MDQGAGVSRPSRRSVLGAGVGVLAGLAVARQVTMRTRVAAAQTRPTPDEALERLLEGNRRFAAGAPAQADLSEARRAELVSGQAPFAAIVSCADSRVPPELVFDQGLGDIFICRIAGNIVDAGISGSIEYAIGVLGSSLIMVLGHESCGAVKATVDAVKTGGTISPNIDVLVRSIQLAVERTRDQRGDWTENAIQENVRLGVQRLSNESDIVPFIQQGDVRVVGGEYNLSTGLVDLIT